MSIRVTSSAFADGQRIPRRYTGEGEDVSPDLSWGPMPCGTKQWAVICDDPDAPSPEPWVHWVIYNIPPGTASLPEGIPAGGTVVAPTQAAQGTNSWTSGRILGYRGPLPPKGHGVHHYHFRVYALDCEPTFPPGMSRPALLKAMEGHILAQGELIGTYERS